MSTIVGRSAAMLAAAMSATLGANIVPVTTSARDGQIVQPLRRFLTPGSWVGSYRPRYPRGPGWTFAQVKRMARKAKNRKRHKIAVARKGGA